MRLYNSFTRKKEEFEPLNPPFVGMYICGPTVYGHSHLGHGKSYVSFDVLYRYLQNRGYRVRYVQNITDVGHLTDDADSGVDKIEHQAKTEKLEPMEIAEKYIHSYFEDMDALGLLRPDISPRASGHIPEQIELIKKLIEKNHAYVVDGTVHYSVRSFPDYGKLSGRKVDDLKSGARVAIDKSKKDPLDFALWKKADKGHILKWNSPWGWGYPGWHIECSAMAIRYLSESIDIHGGGLENIFPHHESEIAQSEGATGKKFVKYWLHNNMVTVDGQKMGKSLGNFTLLKDIFEKYAPMVVRLYILRSHYRSPLDFSDEGMEAAKSALERLTTFRIRLNAESGSGEPSEKAEEIVRVTRDAFLEAMDDDLNTPIALARIFDMVRNGNILLDSEPSNPDRILIAGTFDEFVGEILGIRIESASSTGGNEGALRELLGSLRGTLRSNKLFEEADSMRKKLEHAGYKVKDLSDGSSEIK